MKSIVMTLILVIRRWKMNKYIIAYIKVTLLAMAGTALGLYIMLLFLKDIPMLFLIIPVMVLLGLSAYALVKENDAKSEKHDE